MAPGDMLAHGDLGLLMLAELPSGAVLIEKPEGGQLAPGNSKGSRHCIPERFLDSIEFYAINDGDRLSDLILVASEPFDLTHPEHADHLGYPAAIYRVRHQQTAARTRIID